MSIVNVVTRKYNLTLRDPETGMETTTIATEEEGGPTIEEGYAGIGMEIVRKDLIEAIQENVTKVDPADGSSPAVSPHTVQRKVLEHNEQAAIQQNSPQGRTTMLNPPPVNIPEKIIQHGGVRLKLVNDKAFVEEWVEQDHEIDERKVYKIVNKDGKEITSQVVILHKEWVEMVEEKKEEPEPEVSEDIDLATVFDDPTPVSTSAPSDADTEVFSSMINDLIKE